jgi:hypothetical protein
VAAVTRILKTESPIGPSVEIVMQLPGVLLFQGRGGNGAVLSKERLKLKQRKLLAALESFIAVAAGALGLVTVFWRDWIEALTGWDPDRHSGSAEWLIVAILLAVAAISGLTARRSYRRLAAARE